MQIVAYNADGSGYARIKVPAMNKVEINVTLEGIKVVKGGCVVAGKASFTGANLEATFKQKLDSVYAVYNAALDIVAYNADAIAKTYNSILEVLNGSKSQAKNLLDKINSGTPLTKKEVQMLINTNAEGQNKLELALRLFDKNNPAPRSEATLAKRKIITDALEILKKCTDCAQNSLLASATTPAPAPKKGPAMLDDDYLVVDPCVTELGKAGSLDGDAVNGACKVEPVLMIEYLGKKYENKSKILLAKNIEVPDFILKNIVESEAYNIKIKNGDKILFTPTVNPFAFIWPDGVKTLLLEATQGEKKISLTLQRPLFSFKELYAIDEKGRNAKSGETLYLVGKIFNGSGYVTSAPVFKRDVKYKIYSDDTPADFSEYKSNWSFASMSNGGDRKSTRLNSSHRNTSRMPSSA